MKTTRTLCGLLLALSLGATAAHAEKSVTGKKGGSASGEVTRKGDKVTATGSATGPKGNTASGTATVTPTAGGDNVTGSVTGPQGGTTTGSGTVTRGAGSTSASGTVTGPRGGSGSGTVTVPVTTTPPPAKP